MRSKIVLFISLTFTLFNGVQLFAQSSGSKNGPPAPNTNRMPGGGGPIPVDAPLPIDDNIMILLIAGIALGVYYVYTSRTAKKKAA